MKKITSLFLLTVLFLTGFTQMPQWKKQVLIGSAITVGAAGAMVGGGFTLYRGIIVLGDMDDENEIAAGAGLTAAGCILLCGGIAFGIAGPFVIAHGVKDHKQGPTVQFTPIQNSLLDKYQCSRNNRKFASVCFTF